MTIEVSNDPLKRIADSKKCEHLFVCSFMSKEKQVKITKQLSQGHLQISNYANFQKGVSCRQ